MRTRSDLRNVAIIAHVDHGKTTLVDAMLRQSGVFREGQAVETRVLDSNPLERERGITILAKNTAIRHGGVKFNIVDTPGHADFGGEVERVLQMVQGVLLLVDAAESVMPQTRFVLRKALELDLRAIVVINKIDRRDARPVEVVNDVFDLFIELGAADVQADFAVIYTNAKAGIAKRSLDDEGSDLEPLFEAILARVPEAPAEDGSFQLLISAIDHNQYVGRIGVGRIFRGFSRVNMPIAKVARDGAVTTGLRLTKLLTFQGLERLEVDEASAGDIVCISGIEDLNIGDTIADGDAPEGLHAVAVDEPTVSMFFSVNTSPFAGREGKFLTSRQIRERLVRELESNVALRVLDTPSPDTFEVRGRGELHLAILIETMRREGYELAVSKPQVIVSERNGARYEPVEYVVIDVPESFAGAAIEALGRRKATMSNLIPIAESRRLEYTMPTRAIFGLRGELLTLTRGTAVMSHTYYDHQPWQGELPARAVGALVASDTGRATGYALMGVEQRGRFFVGPGIDIYEGMIVGRANDSFDVALNVVREKKLTNMRAAGSDENVKLAPPEELSLERAIEFIEDDELVEVTPKSIRLRKRILSESERLKARRREASALTR
ncbi:MAG TPA: translational GTPase TypA [Candidatus Dormibacteraeota bacterium]|nr:translational GTPase TypA [Candidatus Dormibacteraeota bacterium]